MPVIAVNYWHTCFSNMKQIVLSILLLFIGNIVWAQSVLDSISYRFVYDVQAKVFEKVLKRKLMSIVWTLGKTVLVIIIVFGKVGATMFLIVFFK